MIDYISIQALDWKLKNDKSKLIDGEKQINTIN